jgi:hypothetical protein
MCQQAPAYRTGTATDTHYTHEHVAGLLQQVRAHVGCRRKHVGCDSTRLIFICLSIVQLRKTTAIFLSAWIVGVRHKNPARQHDVLQHDVSFRADAKGLTVGFVS